MGDSKRNQLKRTGRRPWHATAVRALVLLVATMLYRLHQAKRFCLTMLKIMWENAPWFMPAPEASEPRVYDLGYRLTCRVSSDGNSKALFWTDGDNVDHQMIVLNLRLGGYGRRASATDETLLKSIYLDEEANTRYQAIELDDAELNRWLEGWSVNRPDQIEKGGSSPA
jgi:hypothetical protein